MKRCDRCKFWVKIKEEGVFGGCRRYTPVPSIMQAMNPITREVGLVVNAYFFKMNPDLWCGEYRRQALLIRLLGYVAKRVIGFLSRREKCLTKEKPKNILTAVSPTKKSSLN